jgi:hypothetical protein
MDQQTLNRAMQARAEVITSPVEKGLRLMGADLTGYEESPKGFFSGLFKSKPPVQLLCFLCQGGIPKDAKQWCSDMMSTKSWKFYDNWEVYVQEINSYPTDPKMYLASHAMVITDFLSLQKPDLGSLEWDPFTDKDSGRGLIYTIGF